MENALLTFTGFQDPYSVGLIGDDEQPGPILSLLLEKNFNRVFLFSTPKTENNSMATFKAIKKLHPEINVEILEIVLDDPTDYLLILKGLRKHFGDIREKLAKADYYISVSSGTPQMHACWVLLAACGDIPAHILNTRPQRFVSKERPIVSEIDLSSKDFPSVRARVCEIEPEYHVFPNLNDVIRKAGIVGDHPLIQNAIETCAALAQSSSPILLMGETGTGKELFARLIHLLSGRSSDRFIPLNCAAIPHELVESILFGHKKGAFTGAVVDQTGKFREADKGTLFLDELGELPLTIQAKLLRVLEDGVVEPLGGKDPYKVNVRIIAATNIDLGREIRQKRFREDLYYRLNVGEIRLPSLRERKSDIPKLALHILDQINSTIKKPKRFSPEALVRLENHSWPGNVRDLENVIERSARLCRKEILEADDLIISEPISYADPLTSLPDPYEGFSLENYLNGARKQLILKALEMAEGNQSKAARFLGITPQAVFKFLKKDA